jgi:hypothetical protein
VTRDDSYGGHWRNDRYYVAVAAHERRHQAG